MFLSIFQTILRPIFGTFEREEFKKFLRMGLIFISIIGTYWTLRVLKKILFIKIVGATNEPYAKIVSIGFLLILLIFYNKLLDRFPREKVFYAILSFYGSAFLVLSAVLLFVQAAPEVIAMRTGLAWVGTQAVGYGYYVLTESFGSLVVALFWAIASDTTRPESAKNGFYFVTAIGQMGAVFGPLFLTKLPRLFGFSTDAITLFIAALCCFAAPYFMYIFLSKTPKNLLESYHGHDHKDDEVEPGFFEGLKLIFSKTYLLGMFSVIMIFEIIVTIFDFNFGVLAGATYSGHALSEYMGAYGSYVNIVALVSLLLGIGNITRFLGISVALILMPIIIGCALFGFISFNSLTFLFWLMVGSKAINYALNGPAMKQLYIPTSKDARFKAQAWIETFGSRAAKGTGSAFNATLKPLQAALGMVMGRARYMLMVGWIGFSLVGCWMLIAFYLGKTYNRAIKDKSLVC